MSEGDRVLGFSDALDKRGADKAESESRGPMSSAGPSSRLQYGQLA